MANDLAPASRPVANSRPIAPGVAPKRTATQTSAPQTSGQAGGPYMPAMDLPVQSIEAPYGAAPPIVPYQQFNQAGGFAPPNTQPEYLRFTPVDDTGMGLKIADSWREGIEELALGTGSSGRGANNTGLSGNNGQGGAGGANQGGGSGRYPKRDRTPRMQGGSSKGQGYQSGTPYGKK